MNTTNLDKINELIAQNNFEQAKIDLGQLLEADVNNIEALKLMGLCNINLGLFNQGKTNFETVVKYRNDDATSWFYLANCYENLNDLLHAKSAYLKVLELRENYTEAHKALCIVYIRAKEESKAIELGQKALLITQDDYALYYMVGTAYLASKQFKESIPFFEKAIELKPKHAQLHNNIGTAYLTTGVYDKAYDHYMIASELDPKNSITFYNLASILQINNKHKEACEFFEKAYNIENAEHYLVALALSEFKSEQYEAAINHYKILVSQHPEKHTFQYNLACCYEKVKEYNFAIGILDQLVLLNPKSTTMAKKLADLYLKTNQPLKAKEIYQTLVTTGAVSADIYYEYALICVKTNDTDTAETILKKVIELDPNYAFAHKDLGVIYLTKRLFDYAKDEFQKAYNLLPDNTEIIFEYANFLHATSDFSAAKKMYETALEKAPNDPNILVFAALNLIEMNDVDNALKTITSALNIIPEDDFVLFCAGKINYLAKNHDAAQMLLIKSYEKNQTAEVESLLGLNYFELKEFDKANDIFLHLLEKSPMNTNLLLNSAKCFEALSQYNEAEAQLQRAINIFPDFEEANESLKRIKKLKKETANEN
jgi:tetratricopeptide (TPR) repeat protein